MADAGRPAYTDEDYKAWLSDMEPILKKGNSIYYACNHSGLSTQYDTILEKYKLNDWFSKKIDAYRSYPGELVNSVVITELERIDLKQRSHTAPLDREDIEILKLVADKHRTAQPFFVTRTENAEVDPAKVGKVLDVLEATINDVGQEASKQVVEANTPIQDKG